MPVSVLSVVVSGIVSPPGQVVTLRDLATGQAMGSAFADGVTGAWSIAVPFSRYMAATAAGAAAAVGQLQVTDVGVAPGGGAGGQGGGAGGLTQRVAIGGAADGKGAGAGPVVILGGQVPLAGAGAGQGAGAGPLGVTSPPKPLAGAGAGLAAGAAALGVTTPVSLPTWGLTTPGTGASMLGFPSGLDQVSMSQFTGFAGGTVNEGHVYFDSVSPGHARVVICTGAVGTSNPKTIVGLSDVLTNPVVGWNTFSFSTPPSLAAGDYWLGVVADAEFTSPADVTGNNEYGTLTYSTVANGAQFYPGGASSNRKTIFLAYTAPAKFSFTDDFARTGIPTWAAGTTYAAGDIITYTASGSVPLMYESVQGGNVGHTPPSYAAGAAGIFAWWRPVLGNGWLRPDWVRWPVGWFGGATKSAESSSNGTDYPNQSVAATYRPEPTADAQFAQMGAGIGVGVRLQTGVTGGGYYAQLASWDDGEGGSGCTLFLVRITGSTEGVPLINAVEVGGGLGVLKLTAEGNQFKCYRDGVQVGPTITDDTWPSGKVGIAYWDNNPPNLILGPFLGGDL